MPPAPAPLTVAPPFHTCSTYHIDDPIENLRLKMTLRKCGLQAQQRGARTLGRPYTAAQARLYSERDAARCGGVTLSRRSSSARGSEPPI